MANQYPEGTSPTVKLKNGSEEDRAMVAVTLVSLAVPAMAHRESKRVKDWREACAP